jgi:hypothetical protein
VKTRYELHILLFIIGPLSTLTKKPTMASIIDPESAKSLIAEYKKQNAADGGPGITTPDKQFLHGYFLDRESLEHLLSNPKVVGVSLHFAKHPDHIGSPHNHFTMLYAGAEPNTTSNATTTHINTGPIYGNTPPCPEVCGSISSDNS